MKLKWLAGAILSAGLILQTGAPVNAAGTAVRDERADASYWTERTTDGEALLLTAEEVAALNQKLHQPGSWLTDLSGYPERVAAEAIRADIIAAMGNFAEDELPGLYKDGQRLTRSGFEQTKKNCNLEALPDQQEVRYAVVTQRADMRLLPEAEGWLDSTEEIDSHYDNLQGTALDPAEPLAVLAESHDHQFVFARSRNYMGWVSLGGIAFTDRRTWMQYVAPKDFLVVTANKKRVHVGGAWKVTFQMGSVIPLVSPDKQEGKWTARIPVDVNLQLSEALVSIEDDGTVNLGWLPCTKNNFIRQGFRFLGDEYGWGGQDESVDCSALVGDVYRTMGIELPRDANKQEEMMPVNVPLAGLDTAGRYQKVKAAVPGSLFFLSGRHVMMYLGQDEAGTPMSLHSLSSYLDFSKGNPEKKYIRQVILSDLHFLNKQKLEAIDRLSNIGFVK